jgi:type I restriction enzyme M protein
VRAAIGDTLSKHDGASLATEKELSATLDEDLVDLGHPRAVRNAIFAALAVRDEDVPVITDRRGNPEPDPELRDQENVPLPADPVSFEEEPTERLDSLSYRTAIDDYMREEVLSYVSDAWVDHEKTKIGYEIPLTRHFYKYVRPRELKEIDCEIKAVEEQIQRMLAEMAK